MQVNDMRTYLLLKPFQAASCIAGDAIWHRNLRAVVRLNFQMHDDFLTVHLCRHETVGAIGFDGKLLGFNHLNELCIRDTEGKAEPVLWIFLNHLL